MNLSDELSWEAVRLLELLVSSQYAHNKPIDLDDIRARYREKLTAQQSAGVQKSVVVYCQQVVRASPCGLAGMVHSEVFIDRPLRKSPRHRPR